MKAFLVLSDGTIFEGKAMGASGSVIGETVFNTGMTGYQEVLTDPSYYGQIVCMTYPIQGNYGINTDDFESKKPWVKGFIVRDWCEEPSNFRNDRTLDKYLKDNSIIGIYGIDTRALTRRIREKGVMNGAIVTGDCDNFDKYIKEASSYIIVDAVKSVTTDKSETFKPENAKQKVALLDFGCKENIVRSLLKRNCEITVLPGDTKAKDIISGNYDGIMLTNGPGDPAENTEIINELKVLLDSGIPMFGICLGHQLLALASGAKTAKLKYGHRGANHPVKDIAKDRTYITSQNHGYAVVSETLKPDMGELSHINMNDMTCEGIKYKNRPVFSVQFHPEACPGPMDNEYLFDEFVDLMNGGKK